MAKLSQHDLRTLKSRADTNGLNRETSLDILFRLDEAQRIAEQFAADLKRVSEQAERDRNEANDAARTIADLEEALKQFSDGPGMAAEIQRWRELYEEEKAGAQADAEKIESLTKLHDEDRIVITSQALRIKSLEKEVERLKQRLVSYETAQAIGPSSGGIEGGQKWRRMEDGKTAILYRFTPGTLDNTSYVDYYIAGQPDDLHQLPLADFLERFKRI